jgi:hypothetical protein
MTSAGCPACGGIGRHDQVGTEHPTPLAEQAAQHGGSDGKGRVRDHSELPLRQTKVGRVGFDNDDREAETLPEPARPLRVQLHGDDSSTRREQSGGHGPATGTDVYDHIAWTNPGGTNETCGPKIRKFVVAPPGSPFGGHGAP